MTRPVRWCIAAALAAAALAAAPGSAAGQSGEVEDFGETPQSCEAVGRDYTDRSCTVQTRNGTFTLSAHVVRAGETLTGTVGNRCSVQGQPCPIDWDEMLALGQPVSGCTREAGTCVVRISKRAPTTRWQIITVGITSEQGTGISKDYVAVLGRGRHVLAGHVRDEDGKPVGGVKVVVTGPGGTRRRKTDATGYYSAVLRPDRYEATAKRDRVKPVKSGDCKVVGAACRIRLDRNRTADFEVGIPLRYLAINVGNVARSLTGPVCWEYKLCQADVVQALRGYIAEWKPDVVMLSEVFEAAQLTHAVANGPVLPDGWTAACGASLDRFSGEPAAPDAPNASHQHECVAWKTERLSYVDGSARSAYGRNDAYGRSKCPYDFTGFRVRLQLGDHTVTAVAVHPNSAVSSKCRREEIARYWSELADGERTVIGGDWNTSQDRDLQRPGSFKVNYMRGQHWKLATHPKECSAKYRSACFQLDHAFSNFGDACTTCGDFYGTGDLKYGSALGSYDGHPRADGGTGMDHRQILVDLVF